MAIISVVLLPHEAPSAPKGKTARQECPRGAKRFRSVLFVACLSALIVVATGCATRMVVTPQLRATQIAGELRVCGQVKYDGNRDYLPRALVESTDANLAVVLEYTYQTAYGRDNTPQALPLYNPLTIVGFPIGDNTLVIKGSLRLLRGTDVLKEYSSTCGMEVTRSVFYEGDTYSEMRKKGLIAVRDNIEQQMYVDREWLSSVDAPH